MLWTVSYLLSVSDRSLKWIPPVWVRRIDLTSTSAPPNLEFMHLSRKKSTNNFPFFDLMSSYLLLLSVGAGIAIVVDLGVGTMGSLRRYRNYHIVVVLSFVWLLLCEIFLAASLPADLCCFPHVSFLDRLFSLWYPEGTAFCAASGWDLLFLSFSSAAFFKFRWYVITPRSSPPPLCCFRHP